MKEKSDKLLTFIAVILTLCLIGSFIMIHDLSEQVDGLEKNLSYQVQSMKNQIDSIYANVDTKLEQQASLLSYFIYTDGEFHPENNTAELIIKLTPKILTDDMVLYISFNGKEYPFTRNDNEFICTITVDAFEYYDEKPVLNIRSDGETKTQVLDEIYIEKLGLNHIGSLSAHGSLSSTLSNHSYNKETETYPITFDGPVFISYYKSNSTQINNCVKNAYITAEINGKEVKRTDIKKQLNFNDGETSADITYRESFDVKKNDTVDIFVVVVDIYGYTHKYMIENRPISYDDSETHYLSQEQLIYDGTGKFLTAIE